MNLDQFWAHVGIPTDVPDEQAVEMCWPWQGARNKDGYGVVRLDGQVRYAFHVAHEQFFGPVAPGLVRRHLCNFRACCNPFHIQPGTQCENVHDRRAAGTGTTLDASAVREIRRRYAAGETSTGLSREFGVTAGYIRQLCCRKPQSWRGLSTDNTNRMEAADA